MDANRTFEQTELTKTIIMALKNYVDRGRVQVDEYNCIRSYNEKDVNRCLEVLNNIHKNQLDVRFVSREE